MNNVNSKDIIGEYWMDVDRCVEIWRIDFLGVCRLLLDRKKKKFKMYVRYYILFAFFGKAMLWSGICCWRIC